MRVTKRNSLNLDWNQPDFVPQVIFLNLLSRFGKNKKKTWMFFFSWRCGSDPRPKKNILFWQDKRCIASLTECVKNIFIEYLWIPSETSMIFYIDFYIDFYAFLWFTHFCCDICTFSANLGWKRSANFFYFRTSLNNKQQTKKWIFQWIHRNEV